ncbi:MAG: hypothetical protein KAI47_17165, partial [Deltaproteobacteria bacterium]|nr:hypothetical protein [Deltaproteobacteria bacterium]
MSRPSDPRQIVPSQDDACDLGVDMDLRHAEHLLRRVGDPDVRARLHRTLVLWDLGYTREALSQFRVVAESTLGRLLNALAEGEGSRDNGIAEGEGLRDAVSVAAIDTQRARLARGQISKVVEWLYGEAEVLPARLALHLHTLLGWGNYASHHQRGGHHARGSDLAVLLSVAIDVEAWSAQRLGARSIFDAEDDAWRAQEVERAGVALGLAPEVARRFVAAAGAGSCAETDRLIAPHLALELFFAPPVAAKALSRAAPYRGLESFDLEDAAHFFGRDETIERLLANVQKEPLSVLCGVSGAGKTSLLRAGLVPHLLREGSGVLWLSDYAAPALRAAMQVIGAWPADRLLIVIFDQAEHAMLPETPQALRRGLLELLLRAERWRYGIRMIVSLREDFFGQLLREADAVNTEGAASLHDPRAFVSVGRLTHEATRQAIVRPLEGEEISFSEALLDDLVRQLAGDAGAPPAQLQLVCTRLYEQALVRGVTRIDRALYLAVGGTEKILETYLDETLASERYEGERELARTLLKAMVGGATRRWVDLGELWRATRPAGISVDAVQLAGLLHRLADDRLVVTHAADPGGAVDYSLVHDQLAVPIRDWRSTAEIEREQAQELLDRVCTHFDEPAQRELLGGRQLKLVERHFAILRQRGPATAVLVASRRARRLRWATSLTLAGAALFGLLFGAFQLSRAVDERDRALTVADEGVLLQARLAIRRDPSSAVAWLRNLSSQAGGVGVLTVLGEARRRGVARVLMGHGAPITAVAFSPDGATVVTASHDHTLRRWEVQGARPRGPPLRGHRAAIACMAISGDGTIVASGDLHDEIRLWDRASGRSLGSPLRGHENWVYGLAFSPKAPLLASASLDGTIRLWRLLRRASGDLKIQRVAVLRGHREGVTAVAFSPDGKLLASASRDHTVRLWDVSTHSPHGALLEGHTRAVLAVAFSPDGKFLASAGLDATVRFWDPGTSLPRGEALRHHENAVIALVFSPDGKLLASGGEDKEVALWDVAKRRLRGEPLRGHLE